MSEQPATVSLVSRSEAGDAVQLHLVDDTTRPVVERLLQLYVHDLSELRGSRPDGRGLFTMAERRYEYFTDPDCCAYLVAFSSGPVGFALVRGLHGDHREIGEFFVVRSARRLGIGRLAALELFRRHPGRWEWGFQEENVPAARFWRALATEVARDTWVETRRPVVGKPHIPDDVWISLDTTRVVDGAVSGRIARPGPTARRPAR